MDNLSLGVAKGNCFGLLGINGKRYLDLLFVPPYISLCPFYAFSFYSLIKGVHAKSV